MSLRSRALVALAAAIVLLACIAVVVGRGLGTVLDDERELDQGADRQGDTEELATATRDLVLESAIALGLLVIGLAVLGWLAWRWVLRPLAMMRAAADRTRHPAGIAMPVDVDGPPEIRDVAAATERLRRVAVRNRDEARAAREALEQEAQLTAAMLERTRAPEIQRVGSLVTAWRGTAAQGIVGGDWWDAVDRPDGTVGIVIGDVCGHGVHAGLTAMTCAGTSRASQRSGDAPARTAALLRTSLDQPGQFVTCVIAIIDDASITWLNAGHGTAWLVDASGGVTELAPTGTLLTAHLPTVARVESLPFPIGSALVTCTDGVVERTPLDPEQARSIASRAWVGSGHDALATVDALAIAARKPDGTWADDATAVVVSRSRDLG